MTRDRGRPQETAADRAAELLVQQLVDNLRMSRTRAEQFVDEVLPGVLAAARHPVLPPADPDAPCPHLAFQVDTAVNRVGEGDQGAGGRPRAYILDVKLQCGHCLEPFRFMGVPAGMSFAAPAVSIDEKQIHLPARPASSDPDFGLGIPGYSISVVRPGDPGEAT